MLWGAHTLSSLSTTSSKVPSIVCLTALSHGGKAFSSAASASRKASSAEPPGMS